MIKKSGFTTKLLRTKMKARLLRSFFIIASLTLILFTQCFASVPMASNTQKDTLNIGFVLYTKGNTPGTLYATWTYANVYRGPGLATGGPREGFAGHYHVRYFYENGEFSDEYDLVIEKTGDFYNVSWISNDKVVARGVGMEVENGLAVGWRRISD